MTTRALYDSDQHFYEARDSFTRHLPKAYQRAFRWVTGDDGRTSLLVGDRVFNMIANPTFDPIAKPGALSDYFRGRNPEGADAKSMIGKMEPIRPEYRNRDLRLEVMDKQNVQTALMLPTLALGLEELLNDQPDVLHALLSAFNSWIDDEWGFSRDDRIVAPAVMALVDPELAVAELERVVAAGGRAICFRPAPIVGPHGFRSPGDPIFDRFWSICEDAGVLVTYHAADSGYADYAARWGERTRFQTYNDSPFAEILSLHIERPTFETLAALIGHGVFDRHPKLRVLTIELGAGWAPELQRRMKVAYGKIPQAFSRDPVETFHDHVWITPFMEDNIAELARTIGIDRVVFGSDWPHPEGVASPEDFYEDVRDLCEEDRDRVMSENLRALLAA